MEPIPVTPIVVDRLSRLGGITLMAECPACGHWAVLDTVALLAAQGDLTLERVRQIIRCTRCRHRPCNLRLSGGGGKGGGYPRW